MTQEELFKMLREKRRQAGYEASAWYEYQEEKLINQHVKEITEDLKNWNKHHGKCQCDVCQRAGLVKEKDE